MKQEHCFIGQGSLRHLKQMLEALPAKKVLLVTGHQSFSLSGAQPIVEDALQGKQYCHLHQQSGFVELRILNECLETMRSFDPDSVLAVGGGTVMDAAKLLALLGRNKHSAFDLVKFDLSQLTSLPLIAVPTTAGTGSEATHFAAAYLEGKKISIASPCMLPYGAIVDADLMTALPPYVTAYTGIDALSQAIESFWSRAATEASRKIASQGIILAYRNLPEAVRGNHKARIALAEAAHLSGKAINLTGTTAPHAFSYGFTYDCGIPHGHAVALTLPAFFKYNAQVESSRIQEICSLLDAPDAQHAYDALRQLINKVGLNTNLAGLGIAFEKLAFLASKVDPVRLNNNPRPLAPSQIQPFLEDLFRGQSSV